MVIREAGPGDETAWRILWADYLGFYGEQLSAGITDRTWSRILDPTSTIQCRLAARDDKVLGFSIVVLHEGSWTDQPIAYLEDLFVDAQARGTGLGRALIEDLIALGQSRGWSRLYWHTRADNTAARRLYDAFFPADDFVRYRLFL